MNTQTWLCGSPPKSGQRQRYPGRFLFNVRKYYPSMLGQKALHMFSGSSKEGVTTDLRPETGADIVAPFDAIPRPSSTFDAVLADPPTQITIRTSGTVTSQSPSIFSGKPLGLRKGRLNRYPSYHRDPGLQGTWREANSASSRSCRAKQRDPRVQRL